jgi:hypothetical protein
MTVGELRQQLAKIIGRLFDRTVVGLEFLITGTNGSPQLDTPLGTLTYAGCRNVCLDVTAGPNASVGSSADSIGERRLRKHMTQEPFQVGVDQGLWRLIELAWPRAVFGILSAEGNRRYEVSLRLNFERYPLAAPLVELWDVEARAAIEAEHWPEAFVRFATQNYPQFADIAPQPYCPKLLRISTEVAGRLKDATAEDWDVSGDLTQILVRASCCFRTSQSCHAMPVRQSSDQSARGIATSHRRASHRVRKISTGHD